MENLIIKEMMVPIGQLRPNPRNARQHSELQVEQIAQSIREFGFNSSINVDEDMEILSGHGRYFAAQKLQLTEVPNRRTALENPVRRI
jgi:ParB-like chromosome segregation protein Spo0J